MNILMRFIIYGLFGLFLEVMWTGFNSLVSGDKKLTCTTSLYMFFIYGLAVFMEPAIIFFAPFPALARGVIYMSLIFTAEYASGMAIRQAVGVCPWDYSNSSYNVSGLVRLDYAPCWIICGLLYERLFFILTR